MKSVCIIALSFIIALPVFGQRDQGNRKERLESLKVAFITKEINLTSQESEKFWPIYNDYQAQLKNLRKDVKPSKKVDEMSDAEAQQLLNDRLNLQRQKLILEEETMNRLLPLLGPKRVLKLTAAEGKFKKRVLQQAGKSKEKGERKREKRYEKRK